MVSDTTHQKDWWVLLWELPGAATGECACIVLHTGHQWDRQVPPQEFHRAAQSSQGPWGNMHACTLLNPSHQQD